jgi:hypothetical protein
MDPSGHVPTCEDDPTCGDGDPNTGAGTGGEDDPNVQPPAEPPYCEQFPEQCMTPPADDGGGQGGGDDGNCNVAQCGGEESSEQAKPEVASCTPGSSKSCPVFPGFQPPSFLPRNWTLTVGGGVVVEAVLGFQMDVGVFGLDSNGQLQVISVSPGGRLSSGFGAALDGFVMVTNAKSVNDLSAVSVNAGANAGPVSVDAVWGQSHSYDGVRLGYGAKGTVTVFPSPSGVPVPVPAEVHGGASYTFMSSNYAWLW